MFHVRLLPLLALSLGGVGCGPDATAFVCGDHTDCGDIGRCEASGLCSFEDPDCESGRRYGEYAAELSSQCTSQEPAEPGETDTGSDPAPVPSEVESTGSNDEADSSGGSESPRHESPYFIATDGSDENPGSIDAPFATFEHAIAQLLPGDILYVRGGVYQLDSPIVLETTGTEVAPLLLRAFEDEHAVLDFASNPRHDDPPQPRDDDTIGATMDAVGLFVGGTAEYWTIRGLEIRNAPYYGVRVYGSNNVFDQLILHDHKASGLEITGKDGWFPHDNLVVDCDSFHNFDPQSNGEDADGFAAKFDTLGEGNVFRRTRAWSNADDGYDFWHGAPVELESCWAFDNGFNRPEWAPQLSGSWQGDGIGFKLGQDAGEISMLNPVAFGNKSIGIDDNGNGSAGGVTIINATAVNNNKDGNPVQIRLHDSSPHTIVNSVAFDIDGPMVASLVDGIVEQTNSWNGLVATANDFLHVDTALLVEEGRQPRYSDGSRPQLGLRLAPQSTLINAGTDVGIPFVGSAPDLGAFETPR